MNYSVVVRDIISCVGGKENIKSAQHCATRLRLVLKDKNIVDEKGLEEIDAVKGTFYTNGQYQIILGSGVVNLVCEEVVKQVVKIKIQKKMKKLNRKEIFYREQLKD